MFQHIPRPTEAYHTEAYPSISPSRPELNLENKVVLITGGATGIGLETTKAFAQAGAATIAILARSQGPMTAAKQEVEAGFPGTKVLTFAASITDKARVEEIVKGLGRIDILVLNAGTMPPVGPTLDTDSDDLEDSFKVNVSGPFNLVKAFVNISPRLMEGEKTIIYTSTAGIHVPLPGTSVYAASKLPMTYLMSAIAQEYGDRGIRAFAFHPALALTPMSKHRFGATEGSMPFDSLDLPAHFAVWLCSAEADFLKGRFLWAHWDVDELKAKSATILNDPSQLTLGLVLDKVMA